MSPPSIYELCRPRADVLEGRIRDEDFAATLSPAGGSTDGSLQWVPDVKQAASGADPLLLLTGLQVFAQIDWPVVSADCGLGPGSSTSAKYRYWFSGAQRVDLWAFQIDGHR